MNESFLILDVVIFDWYKPNVFSIKNQKSINQK